jgi:hypothetical protein
MTLAELDALIDSRLKNDGRPVIEFHMLSEIIGMPRGSWWLATKGLTQQQRPRSMFRAAGRDMLQADEAGPWCKQFIREHGMLKRLGVEEEPK